MADNTYTTKVYHKQSRNAPVDTEVVADSGLIDVEAGGAIVMASGAQLNLSEGFTFLLGSTAALSAETLGNYLRSMLTRTTWASASMSFASAAANRPALAPPYGLHVITGILSTSDAYFSLQAASKGDVLRLQVGTDVQSQAQIIIGLTGNNIASVFTRQGSRASCIWVSASGADDAGSGQALTLQCFAEGKWSVVDEGMAVGCNFQPMPE